MIAAYHNWVYQFIPFEWASHLFMQNALLAVLLVTPLFAILGTMVVNNKMAFFSDALGHSALTGIAIGVVLGLHDPLGAMLVFSIILALGITMVKSSTTSSPDTIIGVFSATAVALGIVILSRGGGFTKYSRYLIGDILSISPGELVMLIGLVLGTLVFWVFMFNPLLMVSVNPSLARSRGFKVRLLEIIFSIIMAVIITISIQWVGLLIINSLLILPAASARNISRNMRQYHLFSVGIALCSGLAGLLLSYYWGTATGATIVLCSAVFFLLTILLKFKAR